MRWQDIRFRARQLMIGVAIAGVGLFLLRATWGRADEFIVRQYSEDWRPWNRGNAFRIRLDMDRLRAYNLSKEDLMEGMKPTSLVAPKQPPPPPGVVFVTRLLRRDQYENVILRANAEGEILRLKDVAKVEVDW